MMDCIDYRRALQADPQHPTPEMQAHVAGCPDCRRFTDQILRFDERLQRALRIAVEASPDTQVVPLRPTSRPRAAFARRGWWAMAASALIAAVVAGGLWLAAPRSTLAADVVTHMAEEPEAWSRTDVRVPEPKLAAVLSESHVRLAQNAGLVSYANSCLFRGHQVPHLVVQTAQGPVTVMVLEYESVQTPLRFDSQGYRGVIVPVPGHGSMAVLEKGAATDMKTVHAVATQVLSAISWTD
jgi:hypothetical protein